MINFHYREKLLNAIVYFINNTRYCGKTKLLKLLYFLDFIHFKQTGKPVTNLQYYTWPQGPVPKELFEQLNNDVMPEDLKETIEVEKVQREEYEFYRFMAKKKFDCRYFSEREIKLLRYLSSIFKNTRAEEIVEATHLKNLPWEKVKRERGMFQKIDYLLAIDDSGDSLPLDVAKERCKEREEMQKIFSSD